MFNNTEPDYIAQFREEYQKGPDDPQAAFHYVSALLRMGKTDDAIETLDGINQFYLDSEIADAHFIKIRKQLAGMLGVSFQKTQIEKRRRERLSRKVEQLAEFPQNSQLLKNIVKMFQEGSHQEKSIIQRSLQPAIYAIYRSGNLQQILDFLTHFPQIKPDSYRVKDALLMPFLHLRTKQDYRIPWLEGKEEEVSQTPDTIPSDTHEWIQTVRELIASFQKDPLKKKLIEIYHAHVCTPNPHRDGPVAYRHQWVAQLEKAFSRTFRDILAIDTHKALLFFEEGINALRDHPVARKSFTRSAEEILTQRFLERNYWLSSFEEFDSSSQQIIRQHFPHFWEEYSEKKKEKEEKERKKDEDIQRLLNDIFSRAPFNMANTPDNTDEL